MNGPYKICELLGVPPPGAYNPPRIAWYALNSRYPFPLSGVQYADSATSRLAVDLIQPATPERIHQMNHDNAYATVDLDGSIIIHATHQDGSGNGVSVGVKLDHAESLAFSASYSNALFASANMARDAECRPQDGRPSCRECGR